MQDAGRRIKSQTHPSYGAYPTQQFPNAPVLAPFASGKRLYMARFVCCICLCFNSTEIEALSTEGLASRLLHNIMADLELSV